MSMPAVVFVRELRKPEIPTLTLLPIDKLVLATIASRVTLDQQREAWPSIRSLATDCWMSERRVQRSLSRLEKAKLLHRDTGGGTRTTTYRIAGFSPEASKSNPAPAPAPVAAAPSPVTSPPSPVTPPPVTRDTPPLSPVTPTYKEESERTFERTLKGERAEPIEAVYMPPSTPPKTLASQVIENLSLPNVPGLVFSVEKAISAEANYQHISPAAAARFISDWCSAAQAHGVPINRFAFDDVIWRNHGTRKQSDRSARFINNARVISEMFGPGAIHHGDDHQNGRRGLLAG